VREQRAIRGGRCCCQRFGQAGRLNSEKLTWPRKPISSFHRNSDARCTDRIGQQGRRRSICPEYCEWERGSGPTLSPFRRQIKSCAAEGYIIGAVRTRYVTSERAHRVELSLKSLAGIRAHR
jgi:hypothetical protein